MDSYAIFTIFLTFLLLERSMLCSSAAFSQLMKLSSNTNVMQSNHIQDFFSITEEDTNPKASCVNCPEPGMPQLLDNILMEKVKARILSSLNMKEVPKNQTIPKLQILKFPGYDQNSTNIITNFQELESETLFSQVSETKCLGDSKMSCIRFQIKLSKQMKQHRVKSAVLWMYKRRGVRSLNITQRIFDFENGSMRTQHTTAGDQEENHGWVRFDAQSVLTSMFSYKNRILDLEISGHGDKFTPLESTEKRKPFMIVNIEVSSDANGRRISKRSVMDCDDENSTCCRQKYYVNFREIGFEFIIAPKGYWANFCRGSCRYEVGFARDFHSTVLIMLLANNATEARRVGITVNCHPKALRSMSIIHVKDNNVEVNRYVQNMAVEQCACG